MKLQAYLLFGLMLLASAATFGQTVRPASSLEGNKATETRTVAPAFNVTSLDGKKFELASLRGKVVVLNFWFTGCPPCLSEIPKLNRLVDEFKEKDVVFIAPTWDNVVALQTFLKDHPFKYEVIPNAAKMIINSYNDGPGTVVFPMHLVIDREGRIDTELKGGLITTDGGTKRLEELRNAITRLLNDSSGKGK